MLYNIFVNSCQLQATIESRARISPSIVDKDYVSSHTEYPDIYYVATSQKHCGNEPSAPMPFDFNRDRYVVGDMAYQTIHATAPCF